MKAQKSNDPFDNFSLNAAIKQAKKVPNHVLLDSVSTYRLVDDSMWNDFQKAQSGDITRSKL